MELNDLRDELDEFRPDDNVPDGLDLLMAKVGHMAQSKLRLDATDEDEVEERKIDRVKRDMIGGVLVATMEYAIQNDLDVERAVEERLETMEKSRKQRKMMDKIKGGDGGDGDDGLDPTDDRTFH